MTDKLRFGPLNLSDLVKAEDDTKASYYGVVVDKFCADRISSVAQISFVAQTEEPQQVSFDVIDTLIQYKQAKADVILEVPFDLDVPAKNILVLANSIGVSVLIAPPADKTEENWAIWAEKVKEYAADLFLVSAFAGEVLPVTSYVQYMAMKVMGYTPEKLTDDAAMYEYFEKDMNAVVMDKLKEDLSVIIVDGVGGEAEFEAYVQSTLSAMNDSVIDKGKGYISALKELFLTEDVSELEGLVLGIIAHTGHKEVSDSVSLIVMPVVTEHKDPTDVELALLDSIADCSEEEIEAVNAFIAFVKTINS